MKKFFIVIAAVTSMMLTACGQQAQVPQCDPSQPVCQQQMAQAVQQQGGGLIQDHPIATAAVAAGAAYMVGKGVANHRNNVQYGNMGGGFHQPYGYQPSYVPVQRVYVRPAPYRTYGGYSRPAYTRTVTTYRRH